MSFETDVRSRKKPSTPAFWLAAVFGVALVERILTVILYQPVVFSDTSSYRRLADTVLRGFSDYDGTRTPGYPVFMALVGIDQRVWLVQLLLGLVTTLLLFYIGWKLSDKAWFGGLIALTHTLNLGQLFFESNLLTESLTTFLVVLTMAGVLYWFIHPARRRLWLAIALGIISSCAALVRPLFIYLPFITLVASWLVPGSKAQATITSEGKADTIEKRNPQHNLHQWGLGLSFLIPVALLLGGWVAFIHTQFGDWSLTTMTGYHLVQHTGNFFEYVPDEYASLRDTYIQYRDAHIAQYGTQTNTIWEAIPEMSRVSGYSFYGLSRVLVRLSIQLIVEHPWLYIKSAISGWWMFWRTPVYWSADSLRYPWMAGSIQFAIQVERVVLFTTNLVFIFSSFSFALNECLAAIRRKQSMRLIHFEQPAWRAYFWMLLSIIWVASIIQTLLDHGDNPRFLVPLQSLVVLWVALFFLQLKNRKLPRIISRN